MSATIEASPAPQARENGLATYFQVLFAPTEAFSKLARTPMWGWAAIGGIVFTTVATILMIQATVHMIHATQAAQLSQLPADQAAAQRAVLAKIPDGLYVGAGIAGSVISPWFFWLIGAVIMLIGAALGGGEARFKLAWVAAVNAGIVPGIGAIVNAAIIMLRGLENINQTTDVFGLPSLAMIVHAGPKLSGFLYTYNIVNIWFFIIQIIALTTMLRVSRGAAIATILVASLLFAGVTALFTR